MGSWGRRCLRPIDQHTTVRPRMSSRVLFGLVGGLLLGACASEVGDECTTSSDCATTESDRLCLTQALEGFPGGYCTEFNCDPGSCPSEAVCVGYRSELANADECDTGSSRLQRSYCMRTCSKDSDCRGGYACIDVSGDDVWGAEIIETGSRASDTKICALAYSGADEDDRSSEVCRWRAAEGESNEAEPSAEAGVADASAPARNDAGGVARDAGRELTANDASARPADASSELADAATGVRDAAMARPVEAAAITMDAAVGALDPPEAAAPELLDASATTDSGDAASPIEAAADAAAN